MKENLSKSMERTLLDLKPGDWIVLNDVRRKDWRGRRRNECKPSASHHTDDSEGRREDNLETCRPSQEDFQSHVLRRKDGTDPSFNNNLFENPALYWPRLIKQSDSKW
ncbi:unnamed protein product [Pleuronectes platessa]|uniref:Uncharacterized protein n=1 Tax=Pleuronectes platessa TaxID=8262 RepID=A0A9N7W4S1_PLEPL|nr:unnamed protein product [Pleuronectes platessa]